MSNLDSDDSDFDALWDAFSDDEAEITVPLSDNLFSSNLGSHSNDHVRESSPPLPANEPTHSRDEQVEERVQQSVEIESSAHRATPHSYEEPRADARDSSPPLTANEPTHSRDEQVEERVQQTVEIESSAHRETVRSYEEPRAELLPVSMGATSMVVSISEAAPAATAISCTRSATYADSSGGGEPMLLTSTTAGEAAFLRASPSETSAGGTSRQMASYEQNHDLRPPANAFKLTYSGASRDEPPYAIQHAWEAQEQASEIIRRAKAEAAATLQHAEENSLVASRLAAQRVAEAIALHEAASAAVAKEASRAHAVSEAEHRALAKAAELHDSEISIMKQLARREAAVLEAEARAAERQAAAAELEARAKLAVREEEKIMAESRKTAETAALMLARNQSALRLQAKQRGRQGRQVARERADLQRDRNTAAAIQLQRTQRGRLGRAEAMNQLKAERRIAAMAAAFTDEPSEQGSSTYDSYSYSTDENDARQAGAEDDFLVESVPSTIMVAGNEWAFTPPAIRRLGRLSLGPIGGVIEEETEEETEPNTYDHEEALYALYGDEWEHRDSASTPEELTRAVVRSAVARAAARWLAETPTTHHWGYDQQVEHYGEASSSEEHGNSAASGTGRTAALHLSSSRNADITPVSLQEHARRMQEDATPHGFVDGFLLEHRRKLLPMTPMPVIKQFCVLHGIGLDDLGSTSDTQRWGLYRLLKRARWPCSTVELLEHPPKPGVLLQLVLSQRLAGARRSSGAVRETPGETSWLRAKSAPLPTPPSGSALRSKPSPHTLHRKTKPGVLPSQAPPTISVRPQRRKKVITPAESAAADAIRAVKSALRERRRSMTSVRIDQMMVDRVFQDTDDEKPVDPEEQGADPSTLDSASHATAQPPPSSEGDESAVAGVPRSDDEAQPPAPAIQQAGTSVGARNDGKNVMADHPGGGEPSFRRRRASKEAAEGLQSTDAAHTVERLAVHGALESCKESVAQLQFKMKNLRREITALKEAGDLPAAKAKFLTYKALLGQREVGLAKLADLQATISLKRVAPRTEFVYLDLATFAKACGVKGPPPKGVTAWLGIFEYIINACSEAMIMVDMRAEGLPITLCNPAFTALTGYQRDDVIGKNCRFLQGKKTTAAAVRSMARAIRERCVYNLNVLNFKHNGDPFPNNLSLHPIEGAAGEYVYNVGVLVDGNELKARSEGRRAALKTLRGAMPRAIDTDNGERERSASKAAASSVATTKSASSSAPLEKWKEAMTKLIRLLYSLDWNKTLAYLLSTEIARKAFHPWLRKNSAEDVIMFEIVYSVHVRMAQVKSSSQKARLAMEIGEKYLLEECPKDPMDVIEALNEKAGIAAAELSERCLPKFVQSKACIPLVDQLLSAPAQAAEDGGRVDASYSGPVQAWLQTVVNFGLSVTTMVSISDMAQSGNPIIFVNDLFCARTGFERAYALGRNCRFLQGPGTEQESIAVIQAALSNRNDCVVKITNFRASGEPFEMLLGLRPVADESGAMRFCIGLHFEITSSKSLQSLVAKLAKMLKLLPPTAPL